MKAGQTYEAARADIADEGHVSEGTVKRAYEKRKTGEFGNY
jgi:hypothetical protein